MKYNVDEFYPTPVSLLDKITAGMDWMKVHTVLEPEAGKGDIVEYIKDKYKRSFWVIKN